MKSVKVLGGLSVCGVVLVLTGCGLLFPSVYAPRSEVWWVAADAHVTTAATDLEQAVADINDLELGLDYAIQLGDNVSDQHDYGDTFLTAMAELEVDNWDYVLGNHDFGPDNEPVLPVQYWGEVVNGIKFIFLSDEVDGRIDRDLVMGVEQKTWFFDTLEHYSHKPIILFTHQHPTAVNVFDQIDFDRHDIRAWFHGHMHRWVIGMTEHGFHQLGIAPITWGHDPRQSAVLYINGTHEGTHFRLRFRKHDAAEWISVDGQTSYEFFVEAS